MHPPPQPPYFDQAAEAWVLSRYRDVVDALREPALWPVGASGEDQRVTRDEAGRLRVRGPSQEALSAARLAAWQARMQALAREMCEALQPGPEVDLLAGFALPWCLEFALLVVDAGAHRDRLRELGAVVFAATGAPGGSPLRVDAAAATAELDRLLAGGPMPMGEPTFVALSQTTPRLLASIWVALAAHPTAAACLRAHPELWPGAVEELLRIGGIVRRIWRQARETVQIGGAEIGEGRRVMLMLDSANRDPAQFPDPERLDISRRNVSHLSLGAGRNSCVGTGLIRIAVSVATQTLLACFPHIRISREPVWLTGSGYCFPASVPARLGRFAHTDS